MIKFALKSIATGLLLVFTGLALGQNQMMVETTTFGTEVYPVSEIRSIKFGSTNMVINRFNGTPVTYNISDIVQYYFEDATLIGSQTSILCMSLSINPNPASEQIDIVYSNISEEYISIELIDATGRCISNIYSGWHQGNQSYNQNLDLSAGLYFCRIIDGGKTITKSFVVN
jgi:hypothetical protein